MTEHLLWRVGGNGRGNGKHAFSWKQPPEMRICGHIIFFRTIWLPLWRAAFHGKWRCETWFM